MSEMSIRARSLFKGYRSFLGKRTEVIKDISVDISRDEIFGILGPNGSGKTTLLSIFATLIHADRGSLEVLDLDPYKNTNDIRKLINISSAKPNFPWSLTVKENLKHYAMLYGMHGSRLKRAIEEMIDSFELQDYEDIKFEDLSTGLKQRLSLAKAMLNSPRLLFLDEPTTGLDPEMALKTRSLIRRIHEENDVSVVLSTHYMPEAEMLCSRVAFLRRGRIVALDTPSNLKNQLKLGERMSVIYEGEVELNGVRSIPGVMSVTSSPGRAEIIIDRRVENIGRIIKFFADVNIIDLEIKEPDLEDVYLELAR